MVAGISARRRADKIICKVLENAISVTLDSARDSRFMTRGSLIRQEEPSLTFEHFMLRFRRYLNLHLCSWHIRSALYTPARQC